MDKSFLRLLPEFEKAKNTGNPIISQRNFANGIQLSPNERYLQTTNSKSGYHLGQNYTVQVVDCAEKVLKDITQNVTIFQFIDKAGIDQFSFEMFPIGQDFGNDAVYLKFFQNVGPLKLYSNPIKITNALIWETIRLDYKNFKDFEGISYSVANFFNSIRVRGWFDKIANTIDNASYNQQSKKRVISSNTTIYPGRKYNFDMMDCFTMERLETVLAHNVIYITELDGTSIRVTNNPIPESDSRQTFTNIFNGNFVAKVDYDEGFTPTVQFATVFDFTTKSPIDVYTAADLPTAITATFNRDITIGTGTVTVFNASDNSVVETFTESDIALVGTNGISIAAFAGIVTAIGFYYIQVTPNLINSVTGETVSIADALGWPFELSDDDYDDTEYETTEYL